jgi:hypothetical protein
MFNATKYGPKALITFALALEGQFTKLLNRVAADSVDQYCGISLPLLKIGTPPSRQPFQSALAVAV